jgi:hypothetical protein
VEGACSTARVIDRREPESVLIVESLIAGAVPTRTGIDRMKPGDPGSEVATSIDDHG